MTLDSPASPLALIVGAGPGIGMATVRRLAAEGFALGILVHPREPLEPYRDLLGPAGGGVLGVHVGDLETLKAALVGLQDALGSAELLVFNASVATPGPASTLGTADLLNDFQGSLGGLLTSIQAVVHPMQARRRGTILVTGGGLAFEPKADLASASLGKAAQRSLTLGLAQELEPQGIHVATLAVCGFVQPGTPLSPEAVAQALVDLHHQPPGHWDREWRLGPEGGVKPMA